MEKTLKLILDKLNTLDQKVDMMDQRLTTEQKRQGDLLHQLINTVAATNIKISETNERMDNIEMKVDTVINDVKEIKNSMATKNDLEYYDQMISEHSREIYKLKNS
jgi:seryl-tRNA synthetase